MEGNVVIVCFGLPGSGKSYLAKLLVKKINATYISSDVIRKQSIEKATYSIEEKNRVYDTMILQMNKSLINDKSVVLDATFSNENQRRKIRDECIELNAEIYFIELFASDGISRIRTSKKREFSEADYKVYQGLKQEFESMNEAHLKLDSGDLHIEEMISRTMEYMKKDVG